ncbi:Asp-tRNA(Asn)/Glu-tRNA(Gln) amidotransferase subunit GatB [Candidatus Pacearchaeota archaeon]|nr:Asp-tRNA(Asn)/Glu-tRNA(Gln) amidotransferase subunit GatB [Candidatus Pacearchaeota archaeon]
MAKIGLEIHGYIDTKEKLFCNCKAIHGSKHAKPNTNICPICTGQPGSKPMLPNSSAIDKAIQIALMLGCKVNKKLVWQRKHYSWPDLPKGFQNTISGPHAIKNGERGSFEDIGITECHLEEDPAAWNPKTGEIDYNRSGSPLIEIVTEPHFKTAEQVVEWLKGLLTTLSYIKAIDKKAGIKADVNVSIKGGKRVEMKNINSLKNIKAAIEAELKRQKTPGQMPKKQETRRFDSEKKETKLMRTKEQAADYRFIAEPDLPAINIKEQRISKLKSKIPETPQVKLEKLIKKYKINKKAAEILTQKIEIVEFFESVIKKINDKNLATRWVTEELLSVLNYNKKELDDADIDIKPEHFIELLELIQNKTLTELKAKDILRAWIPSSKSPAKAAKKQSKISDKEAIEEIVNEVIKKNKKAVKDYKSGEKKAINFLVGQVMRLSNKRADFQTAKKILMKKLK